MKPIRILIVDDHNIARQGLRAIIRILPDMELAGEACNGQEAIDAATQYRPDVILMDLVMPIADGVQAITAIKSIMPHMPVVVLTTFAEADQVLRAIQAGAEGYILKDVEVAELARAIRTVYNGQPYLHPEATRHLLQATTQPTKSPNHLTQREQEVLMSLALGHTNRQIADVLHIAEKTVSVHVSNILSKLGLASRTQAALYATRMGIVQPTKLVE
ncbi:MAG: response regulator transcription factor [Chloroflexi bacterium AL-W]|nr:response regulator transcription factor [Chloroflexi bacterium AL-N1]NOK66304.1 response regulator transcription factor [Chloroflexi bacterium AL-N10]NOK73184.1 response regulator transcription factor [Chloroflexi bacterium AL-N5]NOK80081.1 response regulator transcription factor [Chloroflexi bacterium AL-W]NOK88064.1 response regulator transcription factor [Chloroflexi bacterium AL-N15]